MRSRSLLLTAFSVILFLTGILAFGQNVNLLVVGQTWAIPVDSSDPWPVLLSPGKLVSADALEWKHRPYRSRIKALIHNAAVLADSWYLVEVGNDDSVHAPWARLSRESTLYSADGQLVDPTIHAIGTITAGSKLALFSTGDFGNGAYEFVYCEDGRFGWIRLDQTHFDNASYYQAIGSENSQNVLRDLKLGSSITFDGDPVFNDDNTVMATVDAHDLWNGNLGLALYDLSDPTDIQVVLSMELKTRKTSNIVAEKWSGADHFLVQVQDSTGKKVEVRCAGNNLRASVSLDGNCEQENPGGPDACSAVWAIGGAGRQSRVSGKHRSTELPSLAFPRPQEHRIQLTPQFTCRCVA